MTGRKDGQLISTKDTMALSLSKTKRDVPIRLTIYGDGGVGKTTFAASAKGACFITAEDGLVNIDALAVDPAPKTWEEVLNAIEYVSSSSGVGCVVLDSLDWLEPLCWDYTCRAAKNNKIKVIEDFGYGKGYLAALDNWRVLIHKLSALRAKSIGVILIAHAHSKVFKNPEGDDYDKWQLKLNVLASGLIKEWSDVVGFAQVEVSTYAEQGISKRYKGTSTGKRVLRTDKTAAFDAKTRYQMPRSIPLSWASFEQHITGGDPAEIQALKEQVERQLTELADPGIIAAARTFLQQRGENVISLTEASETLKQKILAKTASTNGA